MAEEQTAVQNTESATDAEATTNAADAKASQEAPQAEAKQAAAPKKNYAVLSDSDKTAEDGVEEATAGDSQEGGDAKASEEDGDTQVPVEYEFQVPEGFEKMDDRAIDSFVPICRQLKLSNEQAQGLLDAHVAQLLEGQKQSVEQWASKQEENYSTRLADREIGGEIGSDSWKTKQQIIKTAVSDLPDTEFKKAFMEGNGAVAMNDPGLVRLLYRYGKLISESQFREGVPRVRTKQPGQLQFNASDHANP